LTALVRIGFLDHGRQSSEGQMIRPGKRYQGTEQTG
jgi:hypothetical protein